jgi:hypothetical protein
MDSLVSYAESSVGSLIKRKEDRLYQELGMRIRAIERDPKKAGSFEPQGVYDDVELGFGDDIKKLGERIFRRWNIEAYNLFCGSYSTDSNLRTELGKAFGIDEVAVASLIAASLVSNFGIAPAIAAVIAALIVKKFFRSAYDEFCQVWYEHKED